MTELDEVVVKRVVLGDDAADVVVAGVVVAGIVAGVVEGVETEVVVVE
jgi:hypothetical protein